ncbi:hypothetical protein [Streptantibioticus silvisoli]|uniref:DUF2169 domain-containing protein n=1 Tax=Streptantibioticus silvisoli TaxID=2705255 RepID=A0ABT6W0I4_9ACTN|nr:hypothetical protein [Streptantibioticus silvisoli]MDI5964256.1 hypothetical protein [Streptantibioticus silvisoli]
MNWYPDADETVVVRFTANFASGLHPAVAGQRYFRDPERRDIQGELAGWPPGPQFTPHSRGDRAARRTGRALGIGIPLVLNLAAEVLGALGTPFGGSDGNGSPQEPADEVEDFPVLWAAPGTLARTLPWQLDPGRRPAGYRTEAVLTDRRLVLLGVGAGLGPADVLAEIPRDRLADAEHLVYSEARMDVRLTFADGSWARLSTGNPDNAAKVTAFLGGELRVLTEADLTDAQRARVARFTAALPPGFQPPVFTAKPGGIVLVESALRSKNGRSEEVSAIYLNADGESQAPAGA